MKRIFLTLSLSIFIFSYGQEKTLVFEDYLDFRGPSQTSVNLTEGQYILEVSGTYCGGSCWDGHTHDPAYVFNHPYNPNIEESTAWTWNEYCPQNDNSCNTPRPDVDEYNPEHFYEYSFYSEGSTETFYGLSDECCWGDNQGGLTFKVYSVETLEDILLNGSVSAENNQIKNVADPTEAQDAVTLSLLQTKLDELIERIEVLESDAKYDCGLAYFEDFSSCDLSGFNAQGGNITSTSSSFDGCGVYMTHYAGQDSNNFYATDKKFLYGVYELEAIADNGISDNIVYVLQQEELTGGYTFSLRPTGTDNPGWSVYNDGELVDSADTFPVARGNWYNVKIEVLKSSLKIWINDVVLFETDSITPPSDIPGYFKVGVAYSGGFDNLKFTPDSSLCK